MSDKVKSDTQATTVLQIPTAIAAMCVAAWKAGVKLAPKIAKLREELAAAEASTATALMQLGRACLEHVGNDIRSAHALFDATTKHQENMAKSEWNEAHPDDEPCTVKDLNPQWNVAKSIVNSAFKAKLNLGETREVDGKRELMYPTKGSLQAAVRQVRKPGGKTDQTGGNKEVAGFAGGTEKLKAVIKALSAELAALSPDEQDEAATILHNALTEVSEIRKSRSPETSKEVRREQLKRGGGGAGTRASVAGEAIAA